MAENDREPPSPLENHCFTPHTDDFDRGRVLFDRIHSQNGSSGVQNDRNQVKSDHLGKTASRGTQHPQHNRDSKDTTESS